MYCGQSGYFLNKPRMYVCMYVLMYIHMYYVCMYVLCMYLCICCSLKFVFLPSNINDGYILSLYVTSM